MSETPALTRLQETERLAMVGDPVAILRLVNAVGKFRVLLDTLEAERKATGAVTIIWTQVREAIENEERWDCEPEPVPDADRKVLARWAARKLAEDIPR